MKCFVGGLLLWSCVMCLLGDKWMVLVLFFRCCVNVVFLMLRKLWMRWMMGMGGWCWYWDGGDV